MTRSWLVLDQGGSGSRAIVYGADGRVLAEARRTVATRRPAPGHVEQDPEALVGSLQACIAEVAVAVDPRAIGAAALGCQRSSVLCWDRADGAPLTPVLSWQDTRAGVLFDELGLDATSVAAITGLPPSAHYGASKLAWCLREPGAARDAHAAGRLACGPLASFLLHRLLRERPCLANRSIAQRTLLMDLERDAWSASLAAAFAVPVGALPTLVPDRHAYGTLSVAGVPVPMTVCAGDQNVVPLAGGEPDPDTLYLNAGTGAFLLRPVSGRAQVPPDLLAAPYEEAGGRRGLLAEGTVNGAGAAVDWWSARHGGAAFPWQALDAFDGIDAAPLFINAVSGLGSPFWRADAEPRYESDAGDPLARAYAVLESIAFLVRANVDRLPPAQRLLVSGGLARNEMLCRLLARALGLPVYRAADLDATARGLAASLRPGPATCPEPGVAAAGAGSDVRLERRYSVWLSHLV